MASMTLTLKNVRIAWPDLFTPRKVNAADENEEAKYGVQILLDKGTDEGRANIEAIKGALKKLAAESFPSDPKAIKSDKQPLRDGDSEDANDIYKGFVFFRASAKRRPVVVNRDRSPLAESDGFPKGGDYVNVALGLYSVDNQFGKRLCASLDAVQFVRSGDSIGGRSAVSAESVFDNLESSSSDDGGDINF